MMTSLLVLAAAMAAGTTLDVEDETTRINYSLGYQIGGDFDRQGVTLDADAVIAGIEDARSGSEPRMSPGEMRRTLAELKRRIVTEQRSRSANAELERLDAGRRFLEQNAGKPGIVTTPSGLQYRIFVPPDLAYRDRGPLAHRTLVYDVEALFRHATPTLPAEVSEHHTGIQEVAVKPRTSPHRIGARWSTSSRPERVDRSSHRDQVNCRWAPVPLVSGFA
jgi:hypothetical protein